MTASIRAAVLIAVVVAVCIGAFIGLRWSLRSDICSTCRSIATLCCKPSDYHEPLAQSSVNVDFTERNARIELSPRYVGRHVLYLRESASSAPEVSVSNPVCMHDKSTVEIHEVGERIRDKFGYAEAVFYINVDSGLVSNKLTCDMKIRSEHPQLVHIWWSKMSDL